MYEESKIPHIPPPTVEQSGPVPPPLPGQHSGEGLVAKKSDLVGGFNPGTNTLSITSMRKTGGMSSHMEYQIKVISNDVRVKITQEISKSTSDILNSLIFSRLFSLAGLVFTSLPFLLRNR